MSQSSVIEQTIPRFKGIVAIVGRPNVGKSTLFNRLVRKQAAIVHDQPGVTRDRIMGQAYYDKSRESGFTLIDTGGFETDEFKFQPFKENLVWQQTVQAIQSADLVLLLLDGKSGFHHFDREILNTIEKEQKKVVPVVNKVDGEELQSLVWDFYAYGFENLMGISAAHNKGIQALLQLIQTQLESIVATSEKVHVDGIPVALIGRPNAGKSSILNRLVGEERSVVSPLSGTTRDAIDTWHKYNNNHYVLVDTAGIRRKTKIKEALESQSVLRSLRTIDRAKVVVLVVDAETGLTDQDLKLINICGKRYKPVLLVINKWDLVPEKTSRTAKEYETELKSNHLKDYSYIPVVFCSCLTNQRVHSIWKHVEHLYEQYQTRIPTAKANEILHRIVDRHTPQVVKKYHKRIKFYYATQTQTAPPTIVIKCNLAEDIRDSYKKYLSNQFRDSLGFTHIPFRLIFRSKGESKGHLKNDNHQESIPESVSVNRF